jgi:hypothetical protein
VKKLTTTEGVYRARRNRRVRLGAVAYLTAVMTFTSPIASVNTPPLRPLPAEADSLDFKEYAEQVSRLSYRWGDKQMSCLRKLWGKESAWNPEADNPTSTAYGIAQMLNETSRDGYEQIRNGLRYIQHRYENPCNAWEFWLENKWY